MNKEDEKVMLYISNIVSGISKKNLSLFNVVVDDITNMVISGDIKKKDAQILVLIELEYFKHLKK